MGSKKVEAANKQRKAKKPEKISRSKQPAKTTPGQFRATFDQAPIGILHLSPKGQILRANRYICDLLGYDEEELQNKTLSSLGKSGETQADKLAIHLILNGKQTSSITEKRYRCKDHGECWLHLTLSPVFLRSTKKPAYLIAIARDVTERKRLEEALDITREKAIESGNKLAATFTSMNEGVFVYDAQANVIQANPAALKLFSFNQQQEKPTPEQPLHLKLQDKAGCTLSKEEEPISRVLRGEILTSSDDVNVRVNAEGQRELELSVSGTPIYDANKQRSGGILIFRDITEERSLANELESQINQLEATFEAIGDGICVYNAEGEVIKMNKTARSILGLNEKVRERPGSTIEAGELMRLRAENGEILPPEQWPVNRVLRGEVMTGANTMDIMMKTLDGREILANVNGTSFYESDETLGGVVVVFRDVTQRRQLEKRAHESLDTVLKMAEALVQAPEDLSIEIKHTPLMAYTIVRRLADLTRSVMGNRSVGIVSIDPESQKLRPIAVVGISAEQEHQWLEKLNELSLHDKLSGPQLLERLRANEVLLVDSTDSPPELIASDKGQNELQLAILAPMYTDTQLIGILALDYYEEPRTRYTSDDLSIAKAVAKLAALVIERERLLTEREESRAHMLALRETNQRMDKFISIASHELKTPITTMKGYVQLLGRKIKTNLNNESSSEKEQKSELLKMVSRMETQIDRLIRLEDDLLDVSRIKADQLDLHLEHFNLADLVTKVIDDHNLMYTDREIQLENHTSDTIQIQADAERIEQVVTNYLSNALKYAPPTKPITVHLHTNENQAYVSVKDEGPGLPPEEHKRIWDNFYRVKDVDIQSGSGVGLGIGLHICRSIVEQHKGKYGISSTPGQGSTFWFSIPLSDEEATELTEKQHSL